MFEKLPKQLSEIQRLNHDCPVCQAKEGAILGHLKYVLFDDSPVTDTYNVVCCVQCGFVFCDVPSSQNDYDQLYKQYYYSSAYLSREVSTEEKRYLDQTLNILSPYLKDKNASIFDIGCGTGNLLQRLHPLGYKNLYGVDLSPSCVNLINKYQGIKAEIGSLASVPFNGIKADVIILCHILEHVVELPKAFQGINSKLSEAGMVYVEVPDSMKYGSFQDTSPIRFFYPLHIIHFDENHMLNLFTANGYQQVTSGHHIRVEGELQIPCVWGVFRKDNTKSGVIKPDYHLACQVKTWFGNLSLDKDDILANLASSNVPVYVWGIGIHVQMMLGMSKLGDCNIKCFVDKDERTREKTINGKRIYPLEALANANEREVVVIGAPAYSEEMYRYLIEQVGFKGRVIICGFGNVRLKRQ